MVELTQQEFEKLLSEARQYFMLKLALVYAAAKNIVDDMSIANPNEPNPLYRELLTVRFVEMLFETENARIVGSLTEYGVESDIGRACLNAAIEEAIGGLDIQLMALEDVLNEANENLNSCVLEVFQREDVMRVLDEGHPHP